MKTPSRTPTIIKTVRFNSWASPPCVEAGAGAGWLAPGPGSSAVDSGVVRGESGAIVPSNRVVVNVVEPRTTGIVT